VQLLHTPYVQLHAVWLLFLTGHDPLYQPLSLYSDTTDPGVAGIQPISYNGSPSLSGGGWMWLGKYKFPDNSAISIMYIGNSWCNGICNPRKMFVVFHTLILVNSSEIMIYIINFPLYCMWICS